MNLTEVTRLFQLLRANYPNAVIDPGMVDHWAKVMADVDYPDVAQAFVDWARTDDKGFFPPPGALYQIAAEKKRERQSSQVISLPDYDARRTETWATMVVGNLVWRHRIYHDSEEGKCYWIAKLTRSDLELTGEAVDSPTALRVLATHLTRASRLLDSVYPPFSASEIQQLIKSPQVA